MNRSAETCCERNWFSQINGSPSFKVWTPLSDFIYARSVAGSPACRHIQPVGNGIVGVNWRKQLDPPNSAAMSVQYQQIILTHWNAGVFRRDSLPHLLPELVIYSLLYDEVLIR